VTTSTAGRPFIERVKLVNYKSIAACDVALGPLTVIVGRNGTGKSNFLDGLHLVADALQTTLEGALWSRGGIKVIAHRPGPRHVGVEVTFRLSDGRQAIYALQLDPLVVRQENLRIFPGPNGPLVDFLRTPHTLRASVNAQQIATPTVFNDRLALVTLSGLTEFREAFDVLSSMRFYHLNPDAMRTLQDPDETSLLRGDGSNITSAWRRIQQDDPAMAGRLLEYLTAMVPQIARVAALELGPKESLRFVHAGSEGTEDPAFLASSMSDGTLRALGVLVATRPRNTGHLLPALVGIEEPETALHPGAIAVVVDAMHEASAKTQILVTTHSPEVLDSVNMETDVLLVTDLIDGATTIAGADSASREAVRRHLYTPGDLLRMNQLQPAGSAQ